MSEAPAQEISEPPHGDPAAAFDAMREELALLRAAMSKFAARQEQLAGRDYAPDLAQIIELQDQMIGAFERLIARPAMELTPKRMAAEIEAAAGTTRRADHEALEQATRSQTAAAQELETMIGHARTKERQRDALIWAWLFGALLIILIVVGQEIRAHYSAAAPAATMPVSHPTDSVKQAKAPVRGSAEARRTPTRRP